MYGFKWDVFILGGTEGKKLETYFRSVQCFFSYVIK